MTAQEKIEYLIESTIVVIVRTNRRQVERIFHSYSQVMEGYPKIMDEITATEPFAGDSDFKKQ